MRMQANPVSVIASMLGMILAVIAVYAWQRRSTRGSKLFSMFMISITIYVLGYSMELCSLDVPTMLFWSKIEYAGIFTFPNLFLMFVIQYTGHEKWLTWKNILLAYTLPILLFIAKLFDETWHLVYSTTWVDTSGLIPMLGFTRGPIYPLALYAVLPVGAGLLLLLEKRKNSPALYRNQSIVVIASVLPPLLIFLLYMSGLQPFPSLKFLDLNAFLYPLWGIGIGWAIFRYQLLDLAPIAREALIEHLGDGVLVLDKQSRLVDANPVAVNIMGWALPPIGKETAEVFSSWNELGDLCEMAGSVDAAKVEIQRQINGERKFFDISSTPLSDGKGEILGQLIVIHDITDLKQLEEKLLELSLIDELTGLNNRRGFYVLADQFIQMVRRMRLKAAIIFIDMDNLKTINDTFGHAEGDRALMDTANLLRNTCRSSDILARIGGDEFVILVIESEDNGAEAMLARFNAQLGKFNKHESRKYPIAVSSGAAHYSLDAPCTVEELLERADRIMYENKQAKKRQEQPV